MTEAEWLACEDAQTLLDVTLDRGPVSERKLRLCAVAWAQAFMRRINEPGVPRADIYRSWIAGEEFTPLLERAELFADGKVSRLVMLEARPASGGPYNLYREVTRLSRFSIGAVLRAVRDCQREFRAPPPEDVCLVLRDIIGDPARPVAVSPALLAWEGGTVRRLAEAIDDERAFDRLPILADAVEEAGGEPEILSHLRSPGPHVRGCWCWT